MFFFVTNCLTTSEVCAGVLSWCNNHFLFIPISDRLKLTFSLAVKLPIGSPTRWNKLLMHNSSNVSKNDHHWLDVAAKFAHFFRSRRRWCLPLRRLLLCFSVITMYPWFIISYDPGQEGLFAARYTTESDGLSGHFSRDEEQTSLQFVSCEFPLTECVDMTSMRVQCYYKYRG